MIRRRLFNVAAATSLLLSLAAAAQWAVATMRDDIYYLEVSSIAIGFGEKLTFMDGQPYPAPQPFVGHTDALWAAWQASRLTHNVSFCGIKWETGHLLGWMISNGSVDARDNGTYKLLTINPWLIVAVGTILPLQWFWAHRHGRQMAGGCRACGYNLTANVSGVCPECGTSVPSKPEGIA